MQTRLEAGCEGMNALAHHCSNGGNHRHAGGRCAVHFQMLTQRRSRAIGDVARRGGCFQMRSRQAAGAAAAGSSLLRTRQAPNRRPTFRAQAHVRPAGRSPWCAWVHWRHDSDRRRHACHNDVLALCDPRHWVGSPHQRERSQGSRKRAARGARRYFRRSLLNHACLIGRVAIQGRTAEFCRIMRHHIHAV